MVNPKLNLHHVRTAFIAWHLANLVGFSSAQCRKTVLAALIHDIGGLNEQSRLEPLSYIDDEHNNHALIGSELLTLVPLLRPLRQIVRFHHTHWENGDGRYVEGIPVPDESHLLFFADRIDVLFAKNRTNDIALLRRNIIETASAGAGTLFKNEYIAALEKLSSNEHFWSVMLSPDYQDYIKEIPKIHNDAISLHNLRDIADLLAFIIDQFSHQIPWYSLAVGRIAGYLATKMGMCVTKNLKVEIGGLLHNISVLDHNLSSTQTTAANHTLDSLYPIDGISDISAWCIMQPGSAPRALNSNIMPDEAMLIAISRQWVNELVSPRSQEKSLEILIKSNQGNELRQQIAELAKQNAAQILLIYRKTSREISALAKRIEQLSTH